MKSAFLLPVFFASVIGFTTHAQSLSHVQNLQVVTNQIKVGKMTVALPMGEWRLLNTREGRTSNSNGSVAGSETETKYLVRVNEKNQFVAAMLIGAPKHSSMAVRWNDSVCERKDLLWVQQRDGNFNFPACFAINYLHSFWINVPNNDFDKLIFEWFRSGKVELPKTALLVGYRKYFSGDYINITYHINPELTGFAPDTGTTSGNSNWHPGLIKEDPEKVKYIDALKKWIEGIEPHHRASLLKGTPGVESLPSWPEK